VAICRRRREIRLKLDGDQNDYIEIKSVNFELMVQHESIIEIRELSKSFGKRHAVNNISFSIENGEIFVWSARTARAKPPHAHAGHFGSNPIKAKFSSAGIHP